MKLKNNLLLTKVGLTKQEKDIYLQLLNNGKLSAKQIGKRLDIFPHAVYRTANQLITKGFVGTISRSPIIYQAIPINIAVSKYLAGQIKQLKLLISKFTHKIKNHSVSKLPENQIKIIYGKNEIYNLGAKLLNKTKKEMLVISLGEEITPDLLMAVNKAKKRNVIIRLIAQKYNADNKEILKNFIKNGYEVKHFPANGYHLAIYDEKISLIITNSNIKKDQRTAVFFNSPGLSLAFKDYFYTLWHKASKVKMA